MASKYKQIEERFGLPMSDILINYFAKYGDQANAQELIAKQLEVSQPTVSQWIKYLGLRRKTVLVRGDNPAAN